MTSSARYWAVIPAAGVGSRMQADRPKQYLNLFNKSILEHTLERFCYHPSIQGVVVVVSQDDPYWPTLHIAKHEKIYTAAGGEERCQSVLNGLHQLLSYAEHDDWVLVHDAARPCLTVQDINLLIETVSTHAVGGILATPVRDTMKRCNDVQEITETIDRQGLWHALTPQMFRLASLQLALADALKRKIFVTDEAQAMELTGVKPLLIQGQATNIKITHMGDIALAEYYLKQLESV